MEDVLAEIEQALREQGMSARQASIEAVGNDAFVKRLRRGQVPTVERLVSLCEVLDLEFYVGRRREPGPVDEHRLGLALETAIRALEAAGKEVTVAPTVRIVVALYGLIGSEGEANTARVNELVTVLTEAR